MMLGVMVGHRRQHELSDEEVAWRRLLGGIVRQTVEDAARGHCDALSWLAEIGVNVGDLAPLLTRQGGYGPRAQPMGTRFEEYRLGGRITTIQDVALALSCSTFTARYLILQDVAQGRARRLAHGRYELVDM